MLFVLFVAFCCSLLTFFGGGGGGGYPYFVLFVFFSYCCAVEPIRQRDYIVWGKASCLATLYCVCDMCTACRVFFFFFFFFFLHSIFLFFFFFFFFFCTLSSCHYTVNPSRLLLLNTTCPVLANSVDPDQLASSEAN